MLLVAAFFTMILVFSVFVSSGLSIPLVSAQSALQAPTAYTASDSLPSTSSGEQGNPSLDPLTGSLINEFTNSQTYPYQDSYEIPTSPTLTLPGKSLPLEGQQLFQENSLVDFTPPETTISFIVDGNNVQLQEGVTTISHKVVLNIQGTDDVAVTGFQCVLDNLQQDPSICRTNPVVAENLQPGPHLFLISSIDSSGNIDTTPAVFSWSVAFSDQHLGSQQASQQFQQQLQPMLPLQQELPILPFQQEETVLPYQTNTFPYVTVAPDPSNDKTTNMNENQQTLQPLFSQSTANPTLVTPQYSTTDSSQTLDAQQSQYHQNLPQLKSSQTISSLQQPPLTPSLLPLLTPPFDYSQPHQQQIATANKTGTGNGGSGQNQNIAPLEPQTQDNLLQIRVPSISAGANQADNHTSHSDSKLANMPVATTDENINSQKQIPLQLSNASINSPRILLNNANNRTAITTDTETDSTFPTSRLPENITSTLDSVAQSALSSIPPNSTSNNGTNMRPEQLLQSSSNETIAPILEQAGEKIPNQYIVVLKNRLASELAAEAKNRGASILNIYERVLNGFAIRVPNDRVLEAIQRNPNVAYIEPDMKVQAFAQVLPRGVNRVDGDLSSTISGNGAGSVNADIAILDTGIQLSHPDLNVYRQRTFVSGTSSANDDNGHGTHVAGIAAAKDNSIGVAGMAPGARLWAVKVLGSSGSGSISTIIKGIDYVTQNAAQVDIANLSLGCECTSASLNTAISNSVKAGVTYVVAAGNSGKNAASFSPANHPSVIAVSAIVDTNGKCGGLGISTSYGGDDRFASFSNFGSVVDIAAPGVSIYSTYKGSTYATLSGTSMAAPHVAGTAAIFESTHPGTSPSAQSYALKYYGSKPSTICDGKGRGYFSGDPDIHREPLLYVNPY